MKYLKLFESNESNDIKSINWELPWEDNWKIIGSIFNRISLKIRKRGFNSTPSELDNHQMPGGLENIKGNLCLKKNIWEKGLISWIKSEELRIFLMNMILK